MWSGRKNFERYKTKALCISRRKLGKTREYHNLPKVYAGSGRRNLKGVRESFVEIDYRSVNSSILEKSPHSLPPSPTVENPPPHFGQGERA